MDLIQQNGQPDYGHFDVVPKSIDIDRYQYINAHGEVLTGWRKRLHYKKFKFCFIQHQYYSIGLAITNMAWFGQSFFYIYNHKNKQIVHWNATSLLSRKTFLDEQPLFNQSYFQKYPYQLQIEHANGVRYIQLIKMGEIKFSARIFCAATQVLSICRPVNMQGWFYTQKLMALNCEGFFYNKQHQRIEFNARSLATLNDSCGFYHDQQPIYGLSCSFWNQYHHRIGLNLVSYRDDYYNQNCLWINSQCYALAQVIFVQESDNVWQIYADDQSFSLSLKIDWHRLDPQNLRFSKHQFNQSQVKITGIIYHQGQEIILLDEYGVFEQYMSD
ncbi:MULTISPECIES: DUF2804 family protein [unclassified Acinetobacter]|uniref:DUF2804 family protein n=1 Tax=unclassified Acinetobacter TaxID=196816 RepID=UPI002934A9E9|nr:MULTISPECIES: DUF2804 family protein [unclassified Acinetobacter]WOE30473.1 DUF2804 family protein [Acinetobacter sp. SAAs470]WOE38664.1 DUF2804 family protein [Acinetobacter sp. SAAs474]